MPVTYSRSKLEPNDYVTYGDAHTRELLHVDYFRSAHRSTPREPPPEYQPPPGVEVEVI